MTAGKRPILHWYVLAVCALALGVLLTAEWIPPSDPAQFRNAFTAFLVLGLAAEAGFLQLRVGSASTSVAFVPFLGSILIFPAAWPMAISGTAMLVAETLFRRKPAIKVLHNTAKEILAVGGAALLYSALGGVPSLQEFAPSAFPFLAAVATYFVLNQGAAAVAIALSTNTPFTETWGRVVGVSLLYDMVTGPVALVLAYLYLRLDLVGIVFFVVPVFFVRHVYQMNIRLEQVNRDLLELMVKAIEARDPYTSGHSVRVARLARAMAQELGLPIKRVEEVATAALLHDVGKIYEEFATLLRKEGKLAPHERRMMQSHPVRSAELVRTISTMRGSVEQAVRHHHESFDGAGYPDGIAGEGIPIGSRIIAIADTVDAMSTDRPYRGALPYYRVTEELQALKGQQFDPHLVNIFCTSPRIQRIVEAYVTPVDPSQPKTVAETLTDLRRAIRRLPAASTRWRRAPITDDQSDGFSAAS